MTKLKKRTKLDEERIAKKAQAEGENYLNEITQKDEAKAADVIIETQKIAEKAGVEDKNRKIDELATAAKFKRKEYVHKLATLTNEMIKQIDFPEGYHYWIGFDDEKMNIIITGKDGKKFGRGIKPVLVPDYDFHAIGVLLTQCENTIDQIEERGAFRKSGIIVPSEA